MKKSLQFFLVAVLLLAMSSSVFAQKKKVAYCTYLKTMDVTASLPAEDPIIKVLQADPNLEVTLVTTLAANEAITTDLSVFDVIVIQESFGSSDAVLKPGGALALNAIPKPFVMNKTYTFKQGRALTTSAAVGGKEANLALNIKVESTALAHDLFKACTLDANNEINMFNVLTNDLGVVPGGTKAINYSTGNVISGSSTLLASPSILSTGNDPVAICVNEIPAGTAIDSETLLSKCITLGMNFGTISANGGSNITIDGLTIWRNAIYILAGLPVPNTKVSLTTSVVAPEASARIIAEKYYTVSGMLVRDPEAGVYIKKAYYENGMVKAEKVVFAQPLNK